MRRDSRAAPAAAPRDSRAPQDSRAPRDSQALRITRLTVRDGKLDIETETALEHLHVSAEVAEAVCERLPNIVNHVCVNTRDGSERFGGEIVGTELAHLFEHIVIELEARAGSRAGGLAGGRADSRANADSAGAAGAAGAAGGELIGHTSWAEELADTRGRGVAVMRTTVTFTDDLVALAAARDASAIVNEACGG